MDSQYGGFHGVSVAYDTVEGERRPIILFNILHTSILLTPVQSKLQLPDDATLDDSTARAQLRLGLFSYPVLQAADILVHRYVFSSTLALSVLTITKSYPCPGWGRPKTAPGVFPIYREQLQPPLRANFPHPRGIDM